MDDQHQSPEASALPASASVEPLAPAIEATTQATPEVPVNAPESDIPWHLRPPTKEAPFGFTKKGVPKKSAAGRKDGMVIKCRNAGMASAAKREAERVLAQVQEKAAEKLLVPNANLAPDRAAWKSTKHISEKTKAAVVASIIGPDVDRFREQFANDLLETAKEMQMALRDSIDDMKPGERAFALSVLIDKGEAMRAKLASNATTAQVNTQINIFDGEAGEKARREIMESLYPKTINVTPKTDGA
jgi:hypothetical protein